MSEDFDVFWRAYPRKVARRDAWKAWTQTASIRPPLAQLLRAVTAARATDQWQRDGGRYVPYAGTWLRGERWADIHEVDLTQSWDSTATGIERMAEKLGMRFTWQHEGRPETFQQFAQRVRTAANTNVVPLMAKDKKATG